MIIIAVISFLVLTPTLTAGAQEAQTISGAGTVMGTASLTVHFSPAGGSFTGSFSQSNATGECPSTMQGTLEGTFDGGDGGRVAGNMHGTRASEKCSTETGASGSFSGNLFANGSGNGTMMVDISGGESGEVPWQVTFSPEAFAAALGAEDKVEDPEDSGARFSSISGMVEIIPPGGTEDDRLFANERLVLLEGTHIITGANSMVILTFADKSTLVMKSDSEIIIPKLNKPNSTLEVLSGNIKGSINKILSGEGLEIKTRLSTTGIKGTIFVVETTPDVTLLKVIEGKVAFTSLVSGKTAEITNGESITADANGLGQKTAFDNDVEKASWENMADAARLFGQPEDDSLSTVTIVLIAVGCAIVLAALAGGGYVFKSRRRKSKAATALAPDGQAQTPPATANPISTAPAPVKDAATSHTAPAEPDSTPPAQAQEAATTTEMPPSSSKYCTNCGSAVKAGNRFCGDCGAGID